LSAVIEFRHVSKRFPLHKQTGQSLQDSVLGFLRTPHLRKRDSAYVDEFWALRDVSFDIEFGETFGIIGANGSGKSTTLKLIARTMNPTRGSVMVDGRVAALLELGAGFHPDLTGRENVYLNASFLGMSRALVDKRMDSIIEFAGLEEFIDVPVKHYSSGMYIRLGFAVAINDILLIDEVLAVGDEQFQRKCLDRLVSLQREGRTIVFVSHGLALVSSFCTRAAWIDRGEVREVGPASKIVGQYLTYTNIAQQAAESVAEPVQSEPTYAASPWRYGNRQMELSDIQLLDARGRPRSTFVTNEPFSVSICYHATGQMADPLIGVAIHSINDLYLVGRHTRIDGYRLGTVQGRGSVMFRVDRLPLLQGSYLLSVACSDWTGATFYDYHDRHYEFNVVPENPDDKHGIFFLDASWSHTPGGAIE
jgi:lipopolysaccharide transport system ATP-binding protein